MESCTRSRESCWLCFKRTFPVWTSRPQVMVEWSWLARTAPLILASTTECPSDWTLWRNLTSQHGCSWEGTNLSCGSLFQFCQIETHHCLGAPFYQQLPCKENRQVSDHVKSKYSGATSCGNLLVVCCSAGSLCQGAHSYQRKSDVT